MAAHPAVAELRADGQRNVLAVAAWVAKRADPPTLVSRPLWEALSDRTGLSRPSVARWLSWLHSRGLLVTVAHGRTAGMRPAVLAGKVTEAAAGNLAAEYLLCHPRPSKTPRPNGTLTAPVDRSETPSRNSPSERFQNACTQVGARARAALRAVATPFDKPTQNQPTTTGTAEPAATATPWSMLAPARTRAQQLALCRRLQVEDATLRDPRLSVRALRHVLRPWLVAGWSGRDVEWAINHRPEGGTYPYAFAHSDQLRNPAGFLVHRLRQWTEEKTGAIPPGPCSSTTTIPSNTTSSAARLMSSATRSTAEAAVLLADAAGDSAGITPADPDRAASYAASIRAALGWTGPRHTAALA